jgi:hypothetical protein
VLARPGVSEDLKNLSIAGLLTKLANEASDDDKAKLTGLLEAAKKFGIK